MFTGDFPQLPATLTLPRDGAMMGCGGKGSSPPVSWMREGVKNVGAGTHTTGDSRNAGLRPGWREDRHGQGGSRASFQGRDWAIAERLLASGRERGGGRTGRGSHPGGGKETD